MKLFDIYGQNRHIVISICGLKIKLKKKKLSDTLAQIYDEEFYAGQAKTSYQSAKEVLNVVTKIVPEVNSVLDIGCGVGTWLKAWKDTNDNIEICGIDANELPEKSLYVDRKNILVADLENLQKIDINQKYDLVESLEVGEHLSEASANEYVRFLCEHSDLILFSAALPLQTGDHHINEQFPQYWNEKFRECGFECFDILRKDLWNNADISWWYRQNVLIFAKGEKATYLKEKGYKSEEYANAYYHPELVKMHLGHGE